ncbi:MAG: anti-sigma factor [Hyphomicrobiales bacterium]
MARPDNELLAAEYALGTLTGADREAAERRLRQDSVFRAQVEAWEKRLAPLAEATPETPAPDRLWSRIEASLPPVAPRSRSMRGVIDDAVASLERRLAAWRIGALASGAAAALALALWIGGINAPGRPPAGEPSRYVAMLMGDAGTYGFVVTVEPDTQKMMVRTLIPHPPENQDYELWLLKDGAEPKTLGIVPPGQYMAMPMPDKMDMPNPDERIKLAISLEPRGGAGGKPMGKVMYAGDLMKLTP